jgi:hypothetical protein
MGIVNQIVGRCHVSWSNRKMLRYVRSRMLKRARSPKVWPERKLVYQAAIKRHAHNFLIYAYVMGGR